MSDVVVAGWQTRIPDRTPPCLGFHGMTHIHEPGVGPGPVREAPPQPGPNREKAVLLEHMRSLVGSPPCQEQHPWARQCAPLLGVVPPRRGRPHRAHHPHCDTFDYYISGAPCMLVGCSITKAGPGDASQVSLLSRLEVSPGGMLQERPQYLSLVPY